MTQISLNYSFLFTLSGERKRVCGQTHTVNLLCKLLDYYMNVSSDTEKLGTAYNS